MATSSRPVKRVFRHYSNQSSNPLQGPDLSASIQTSLLNVGMRIRKSVPEGYKTKRLLNPLPPQTATPLSTLTVVFIAATAQLAFFLTVGYSRQAISNRARHRCKMMFRASTFRMMMMRFRQVRSQYCLMFLQAIGSHPYHYL